MDILKITFYSSNPGDMVCDFFLGGFSTAKIAIGLGRRACGFELNKNAFDCQSADTEKIVPGGLLRTLRPVPENKLVNKGKPFTQEEIGKIKSDFTVLVGDGMTQKKAFELLSQKYGRGYWSLLNLINEYPVPDEIESRQMVLFEKSKRYRAKTNKSAKTK